MLYWSKELPNPLPNPPPALTHTNTTNQRNSWNCSDWRGPLEKEGSQGAGWDNYRKEKKKSERGKKKNIYRSNPSEFLWLHELLWSCYTPSARPTPLRCLLPTLETMTFITEGGENRGGDWEKSTGIREGRAYRKWEACTSWYINARQKG